uniref:Uncharacterized protein n=1 Tax=Culex tarsalis TaxID=7177 RepID=A0A1Q3G4F9_CULTA
MGELVKSCCYCWCTCYQSGICCVSLCCFVIPIVGLLLILAGIVYAIVLSFSIIDNDDDGDDVTVKKYHGLSRLLVVVGNNISQVLRNGTGNDTVAGGH